jgi:3-hydroxyacyl-[acyl-carrier-protein] dehydratase
LEKKRACLRRMIIIITVNKLPYINLHLCRKRRDSTSVSCLKSFYTGVKGDFSVLDIKQIQEIIPHRPPFLLVDRILEVEEGKRALGIKNVTMNEPFFTGHFPDYPVMPGVLIIEALAQVGAVAILKSEANKGKIALFAGIDNVRIRQQVVPGDTLTLELELTRMRGSFGKGKGTAKVGDNVVLEGELMFALTDPE